MANYTINKTGQQINDILDKANKLPAVSSTDNGKTLQVDGNGNFVANTVSGGGTQLYRHSFQLNSMQCVLISTDNTPVTFNSSFQGSYLTLPQNIISGYYGNIIADMINNIIYMINGQGMTDSEIIYIDGTMIQSDIISSVENDTVTAL